MASSPPTSPTPEDKDATAAPPPPIVEEEEESTILAPEPRRSRRTTTVRGIARGTCASCGTLRRDLDPEVLRRARALRRAARPSRSLGFLGGERR